MLDALLRPPVLLLAAWIAAVCYVHFRGTVRLRFSRQILDHSAILAPYNVWMYLFSAVPRTPFQDIDAFPHLAPLRDEWETIRAEALALYEGAQLRAADGHNDIAFNTFFKRGWKRFYLKWYGDMLPSAETLCPRTVALVESIPEVNAALFAMLPAGGKLGKHRDPFAGSLRYHLGLVDAQRRQVPDLHRRRRPTSWRDGEDVVFDETYIHRAVNESDQDRLILFCDVARPLHTRLVSAINAFVTRHIVKITATRNEPDEPMGIVNRLASPVFAIHAFSQHAKKRTKSRTVRVAYEAGKYALIAAGVYLVLRLVMPAGTF